MPRSRWRVVVGIALAGLACARAAGQVPAPVPWPPASPPPEVTPPPTRGPLQLTQKHEGGLGLLTAKFVVPQEPGADEPPAKRAWQTDQAWRLPLSGPFFVFGQMAAAGDEAAPKDTKLAGRTGLACKLPVGPAEFVVRGGPGVSYTDPLRPDHTREQADWQLGVEARLPLMLGLGLEYQGTATPALTPLERDRLRQDVHLAIPVSGTGKVQFGARHLWENAGQPRAWSEGMEVYFGLRLQR